MPLRFRVLPSDDVRPAGGVAASGPLVEREVLVRDGLAQIRVGRRADLELPLPYPVLSAVHARLARDADGAWTIEDVGSTNGTWLDDERLAPASPRAVSPGAALRFGTVRVRFEGPATAASPAPEGTATLARRLADDLFARSPDAAPTIRVAAGAPAAALRLGTSGRAYVVGRADSCALALPVDAVSREHAAFIRRDEGVIVRDLGSKNGVLVHGARITADRLLTDGDTVTIGPATLVLEDPVTRYLAELAQMPAESATTPANPTEPAPEVPLAEPMQASAPTPEPASADSITSAPAPSPSSRRKLGTSRLAAAVAISALVLLAAATLALFLPPR